MMDVRVYDTGPDSGFDRYTALFPDGDMLGIGHTGNTPNGFCQWVGNVNDPPYRDGVTLGVPVALNDLPEPVLRAITADWNEWYAPNIKGGK